MRRTGLALVTGLAAMMMVSGGGRAETTAPAVERKLPAILVIEARERSLTARVLATGTIRPVEEIYLQPQVDGLAVRSLLADVGDQIRAGQVLATLNGDSLVLQKAQALANRAKAEASLLQFRIQKTDAEANLAEAQRQLDRGRALVGGGTISTSQVQQLETQTINARNRVESATQSIAIAEADLKVVTSQIADLDLRLSRTDIVAPHDGIISARNARLGAIASAAGQPLFTIIRDGGLELVADVAETDILKMQPGLKAEVTVAGNDRPLSGAIRLISPAVDPVTRLGAVHIALDKDDEARQGMYGSSTITLATGIGLALPLSAISMENGRSITRVVRDGVVHEVEIATGIEDRGMVLITRGLQPGDLVVAKAGAFVRDGDRITPVRDDKTPSN